jgi:hypothetical protein
VPRFVPNSGSHQRTWDQLSPGIWTYARGSFAGLSDRASNNRPVLLIAPSVITLNATVASQAANDFLLSITGLTNPKTSMDYVRYLPRDREVRFDEPRKDPWCTECGTVSSSRLARGDSAALPTKASG